MSTNLARTEATAVVDGGAQGAQQVTAMNPARMIELAFEKGAIEQLDKLLDLQERWEATEARKAFVRAMAEFKASRPTIHKNKGVGFNSKRAEGGRTEYKHATLDNVDDVLGEHLSRVGISYTWQTKNLDKHWIEVTCVLTHELGHSQETTLKGPVDTTGNKNPIQQIGSTITYLERYTLLAATGTSVRDMDDDGQSGGNYSPDPQVQAAAQQRKDSAPQSQAQQDPDLVNQAQIDALMKAISRAGMSPERFSRSAGIAYVNELPSERFKAVMQHLSNTANSGGAQ